MIAFARFDGFADAWWEEYDVRCRGMARYNYFRLVFPVCIPAWPAHTICQLCPALYLLDCCQKAFWSPTCRSLKLWALELLNNASLNGGSSYENCEVRPPHGEPQKALRLCFNYVNGQITRGKSPEQYENTSFCSLWLPVSFLGICLMFMVAVIAVWYQRRGTVPEAPGPLKLTKRSKLTKANPKQATLHV